MTTSTAKTRVVQRWTVLGDETLGIGPSHATLEQCRDGYCARITADGCNEVCDLTAETLDEARDEMTWHVELAEQEQHDSIASAAQDAARDVLEALLDSGKAMDALKALRAL